MKSYGPIYYCATPKAPEARVLWIRRFRDRRTRHRGKREFFIHYTSSSIYRDPSIQSLPCNTFRTCFMARRWRHSPARSSALELTAMFYDEYSSPFHGKFCQVLTFSRSLMMEKKNSGQKKIAGFKFITLTTESTSLVIFHRHSKNAPVLMVAYAGGAIAVQVHRQAIAGRTRPGPRETREDI